MSRQPACRGRSTPSQRIALLVLVVLGAGCNAVELRESLNRSRFQRAAIVERRVTLPSGIMRYFDGGEGPPVLLIHGFAFGALENWRGQGPAFARHHRVIAPDLFWFGQSIPSRPIETAHAQMQALLELLDALQLSRVDVIGTSYGGLLAALLASEHPERVDRLVLVDAAAIAPTPEETAVISSRFGGEELVERLMLPETTNALRGLLGRILFVHHWIPTWALRQVLAELRRNLAARTLLCRDIVRSFPDEAQLHRIVAPTLVVWGRHDPLILPTMGARLAHAIEGARLLLLEGSGHAPMIEQPTAFNRLVLPFLASPR